MREDKVTGIPVLEARHAIAAYAPLAACSDTPAVVLVFANAVQGLMLAEAITRVDRAVPAAMGRPACALLPAVINADRGASSLGCCGARAYLDRLRDDITLWALPGAKLDSYVGAIEILAKANAALTAFHVRRRGDIETGEAPSVAESLSRLGH